MFTISIYLDQFQVSDEKIGQMRLKFWYDAINKVYDKDKSKKLPEHPVIYEVNNVRFVECSMKKKKKKDLLKLF